MQQVDQERRTKNRNSRPISLESREEKRDYYVAHWMMRPPAYLAGYDSMASGETQGVSRIITREGRV